MPTFPSIPVLPVHDPRPTRRRCRPLPKRERHDKRRRRGWSCWVCCWTVILLSVCLHNVDAVPLPQLAQLVDYLGIGDEESTKKSTKTKDRDRDQEEETSKARNKKKHNGDDHEDEDDSDYARPKTTKASKSKSNDQSYTKDGVMYVDTGESSNSKSSSKPSKSSKSSSDDDYDYDDGSYYESSKSSKSKNGKTKKRPKKAGKLPLQTLFMIFVVVFIATGGILWWWYRKKAVRIAEERKIAAEEKAEQDAWDREQAEIPDPQAEFEADQHVENLPYAPEGLFYDTTDPLALEDAEREGDIADEKAGHHHHHHKHKHQRHNSRERVTRSLELDEGYYVEQPSSFAQVARSAY